MAAPVATLILNATVMLVIVTKITKRKRLRMATLAIDFDHVIHLPSEGGKMGDEVGGAKSAIRKLRNEDGHKIIIYSCKPPEVIEPWMRNHDIPFDRITTMKPNADIYIDDKGFRFQSWNLTLAALPWNLPTEK